MAWIRIWQWRWEEEKKFLKQLQNKCIYDFYDLYLQFLVEVAETY